MILLDTNICIAAIKRDPVVLSRIVQHSGRIYLPFVVSAELYFGLEKRRRLGFNISHGLAEVRALHDTIEGVAGFHAGVIDSYASLRAALEIAGTPIGANDLWIAAQTLAEDALLVTDNIKEFKRVRGLRVENWLKR